MDDLQKHFPQDTTERADGFIYGILLAIFVGALFSGYFEIALTYFQYLGLPVPVNFVITISIVLVIGTVIAYRGVTGRAIWKYTH
jgi:hypothetical protein